MKLVEDRLDGKGDGCRTFQWIKRGNPVAIITIHAEGLVEFSCVDNQQVPLDRKQVIIEMIGTGKEQVIINQPSKVVLSTQ